MSRISKIHFPSLNGLRFIAVLLVIVAHIETIKHALGHDSYYKTVKGLGNVGVWLFFVLSGFLITYLLLKEKEQTNNINLKNFYIRRFLRIYPLYIMGVLLSFFIFPFIIKINIWESLNNNFVTKLSLFIAILPNVAVAMYGTLDFVNHFWSIGVEWQFYMLWGYTVKFFEKYLLLILTLIIIAVLGVRTLLGFSSNPILAFLYRFFSLFEIECMLIGSFGACLLNKKAKILSLIYNKYIQIITYLLLFIGLIFQFHIKLISNIYYSILFMAIILNMAANPDSIINLKNNILDYLGKISYGVYVYHMIAILLVVKMSKSNAITYLLVIFATTLIASISYYLYEKKFLELKRQYALISSG